MSCSARNISSCGDRDLRGGQGQRRGGTEEEVEGVESEDSEEERLGDIEGMRRGKE